MADATVNPVNPVNAARQIPDTVTAQRARWWKSELTRKVSLVSAGIAVLGLATWFFLFRPYVKTDDARVAMTLVHVAPSGVSARIEKVNVEEGSVVKKGDVLVELDHRIHQAQVDRAQAKFDLAKKELTRVENLVRQNSAPVRDLDNARSNFTLAQSELTLAQVALENTFLRAPFDGIVVQKNAEVGNILEPGQSALTVADQDHAWIAANIEETDIAEVRLGQPVSVSLDTGGSVNGKISEIRGATAGQFSLIPSDNGAGNFVKVVQRIPIKVALDGVSGVLRAGQSVELKIKVK